jgi:ribonuclease HI
MRSWIHGWKKRGWKKADNKPPENIQYWKELDELSNTCHVSFNWIKGHAGHPQNEYVDNLANVALDEKGF